MAEFGTVNNSITLLRQFVIPENQFRMGATAPTEETIGSTPTINALLFNATNELVSEYIFFPDDMDKTINFNLILACSLSATESDNDTLDLTCDYTIPIVGTTGAGLAKTSTQITGQATVTTGAGLAIGDIYQLTLAFIAADGTNPSASGEGVAFEFHLTNTTEVGEFHLVGAILEYTALY